MSIYPNITYKIVAVVALLHAAMRLLISCGLWGQLLTFTWTPVEVTVIAHEILPSWSRADSLLAHGKVYFSYSLDGTERRGSDSVFDRFDYGNKEQKFADYIAQFAHGQKTTAYVSWDRSEVSLGHFPRRYELTSALIGISNLALSIMLWRQSRARPSNPSEPSPAETPM